MKSSGTKEAFLCLSLSRVKQLPLLLLSAHNLRLAPLFPKLAFFVSLGTYSSSHSTASSSIYLLPQPQETNLFESHYKIPGAGRQLA